MFELILIKVLGYSCSFTKIHPGPEREEVGGVDGKRALVSPPQAP